MPSPFGTGQIPFTPRNLHALRTGQVLVNQQERQQQELALRAATAAPTATTIEVPLSVEVLDRQREARLRAYEETGYDRFVRWAHIAGLALAVVFVAAVTVMLAIMSIRMSNALDTLDGDTLAAKVETLLDYGIASAKNTHEATGNVAAMTAEARATAAMAAPKLQHAVNDTTALVDDLRSWSFHPSLAIGPGAAVG